ncbi:GGDEF domain-containing protein [Terriglobus aquaticus]|uniref:diguanylate cyclase n=1 Tax=Terriglobus aquaticus TaxID=940139 RepID=A0ABW9KGZ0_9BACT|nr:GGDEF domain-containing protein [Terriglobus aquaticus]
MGALRLDNLTILLCLLASAFLFACSFGAVWVSNRRSRSAGHFSLAFTAGALSCFLFTFVQANGWWGIFLNTVVGDTLVSVFTSLLHVGIRRQIGLSRHHQLIATLPVVPFCCLVFFTEHRDSMLARILVLALYGVAIRTWVGIDLLKSGRPGTQRALAYVMFLFGALSLWQGLGTIAVGAPADYMRADLVQSSVLFLFLLFVLASGLLLFLLLNDDLVQRLEHDAERDFLTGALNRRGFERALIAELERSARHRQALVLGLLDLDHFKRINDTNGHAEGDRILCEITRVATASIRPYDYLGRFGGDEFVLLLPGTSLGEAKAVAERIRAEIAARLQSVSISIGLTAGVASDSMDSIVRRADEALYRAKQDGRNAIALA